MSREPTRPRNLKAEIAAALADDNMKGALFSAVSGVNASRRRALARFPGYEQARDRAREIKERAIGDLPTHIDRFTEAVEAGGGTVHHAVDGAEACRVISAIAHENDVRKIVKSKSMTSEEIHLNDALEAGGLEVRETDLGEYIIQLSGDRPSHIIAPIIHLSVQDVRRIFRDSFGMRDVPVEPAELTQLARRKLRSDFLGADMGITGANFLLADTGTVVVVENEGNGRMTTQLPPIHVALAGIEKLIPSAADLLPFLQLLPRTGTGQLLTSYLSFISGPGWSGSPTTRGKTRSFHVVLLDNGRRAMRRDTLLAEALYCIRCGGCMTVCPPYQVVGGHVYGGPTYHSGIGNAWEAGVSNLDTAAQFNVLCTTCSRCQDVCPVRIDIPWINSVLRDRIAERRQRRPGLFERLVFERLLPTDEKRSVNLASRMFADPARAYRLQRKRLWGAALRFGPTRSAIRRMAGLAVERPLPAADAVALTEWQRRRGGRIARSRHDTARLSDDRRGRGVALFVDCHTEHVETAVGKAAVECLEKCGLGVVVVSGHCCGRAALSQGLLQTARRQADDLQKTLQPLIDSGYRVIGVEPSCLSALVSDHAKLLPGSNAAGNAAQCSDVLDFLNAQLSGAGIATAKAPGWKPEPDGGPVPVVLHGHCQQKTMGWLPGAIELLDAVPGYDVRVTSAECCGMAGSFGYKSDYYAVSSELGTRLVAEIDTLSGRATGGAGERGTAAAAGAGPVCRYLACGTSCRAQIADCGGSGTRHPVELIAERLR